MKTLQNDLYKKEDLKYCLITELISKSDELTFVEDEENYLICKSNNGAPIWIWNRDDISLEKIEELVSKLKEFTLNDDEIQITAKEKIFNRLVKEYKDSLVDDYYKEKGYYVKMESYSNNNPVLDKSVVGFKRNAKKDEKGILAYYKKCDYEDTLGTYGLSTIKDEDYLKIAERQINNPNFYVWEVDGKIVSTASYRPGDNYFRISEVFTDRESRGHGYAGMLVYELCEEIISQGKTPMLYADSNYLSSNKAYQKIGFESQGALYTLKIDKRLKM